jgi:hypothetical protein
MKVIRILGLVVITAMAVSAGAYADTAATDGNIPPAESSGPTKPIQLALIPEVQLVPEHDSIGGLRLNIYGCNQNVTGVDIGFVHETKENFAGVGFGVVSLIHGEGRGLQLNCIYTEATKRMSGLQVGIFNHSGSMHGLQIGIVNIADDMTGIQIGLWNEIKTKEIWNVLPLFNAAF